MKSMNLWNNVTLIQMSEFGRTLNPNGGDGTDHAWGGNYMMMGKVKTAIKNSKTNILTFLLIVQFILLYFNLGGSVKGRQILGEYPTDLRTEGPLIVQRGKLKLF